ncbi:MAG: hypothetical protein AAFY98_09955 [Verrucomicrobiota bacterium]
MDEKPQEPCSEAELSGLRNEILGALNLFHGHVKYTITLLTTVLAAIVALPAFTIRHPIFGLEYSLIVSGLASVCLVPLSEWSRKICRRYYLIYASNYIYCARRVCDCPSRPEHPWIADLFLQQGLDSERIQTEDAAYDFMDAKHSKDPNSWRYYRKIINSFKYLGALGAVFFFSVGVAMLTNKAEQVGADQPATALEAKAEIREKAKPESEDRSQ